MARQTRRKSLLAGCFGASASLPVPGNPVLQNLKGINRIKSKRRAGLERGGHAAADIRERGDALSSRCGAASITLLETPFLTLSDLTNATPKALRRANCITSRKISTTCCHRTRLQRHKIVKMRCPNCQSQISTISI
jgi:hypothetical protein